MSSAPISFSGNWDKSLSNSETNESNLDTMYDIDLEMDLDMDLDGQDMFTFPKRPSNNSKNSQSEFTRIINDHLLSRNDLQSDSTKYDNGSQEPLSYLCRNSLEDVIQFDFDPDIQAIIHEYNENYEYNGYNEIYNTSVTDPNSQDIKTPNPLTAASNTSLFFTSWQKAKIKKTFQEILLAPKMTRTMCWIELVNHLQKKNSITDSIQDIQWTCIVKILIKPTDDQINHYIVVIHGKSNDSDWYLSVAYQSNNEKYCILNSIMTYYQYLEYIQSVIAVLEYREPSQYEKQTSGIPMFIFEN